MQQLLRLLLEPLQCDPISHFADGRRDEATAGDSLSNSVQGRDRAVARMASAAGARAAGQRSILGSRWFSHREQ
jgi:hypothetical protein